MDITVLITGTSSGIGEATAKMFTDCGIYVKGLDIADCPEGLRDNEFYSHHICDVSNPCELPDFDGLQFKWVINNAGTLDPARALDVNLAALFAIEDKYVTTATKCVVNISCSSAHLGIENREYVASKGGVLSYTRQLAKRMAAWGGRCVSISPGPVLSEMNDEIIHNATKRGAVSNQNLLKRWIEPAEIAQAIQFMCTCTCITGVDLIMDCGEHINHTEIV